MFPLVVQKLLLGPEGFTTLVTFESFNIKVGPLVVFQSQQIVEALLAHMTSEQPCFVGLLVVQQGARVSV